MDIKNIIYLLVFVGCLSCQQSSVFTETVEQINSESFQSTIDSKKVDLYTLVGENGAGARVTNYGARIVALCVPDKNGEPVDVVCGYNTLSEYMDLPEQYFGAAIGRFGNRIAKGKFSIHGKSYQLDKNNGANALHGGPTGFHRRVWDAEQISQNKICFKYLSVDGEEGYPGNLTVTMTYELTSDNALEITYEASTDQTTILNLTNHSYFNLSGEGTKTINDHILQINASRITPVDTTLIPTGEFMTVEETPFNFNIPIAISEQLRKEHQQLIFGGGFDHNFVLLNPQSKQALATVFSPITGIKMEIFSDQPGLQFYGGNFLKGNLVGKSGKTYKFRSAFCLETQHFPDSPNQPNFASTILHPGETYQHTCIYKFSIKNN